MKKRVTHTWRAGSKAICSLFFFHFSLFLLFSVGAKGQINTDHMMMVGRNALYFKDYVLSIQYFNQVINAKPYLYDPYFFRGLAKFYLDDFGGAEADCTQAIDRNPFVPDSYQVRALSRMRQGNFDGAIADYRNAVRLDPENEGIWHNMALCYGHTERFALRRNTRRPLQYELRSTSNGATRWLRWPTLPRV